MIPNLSGVRRHFLAPYEAGLQRLLLKAAVLFAVLVLSVLAGLRPSILLLFPIVAVLALIGLTRLPEIGLAGIIVAGLIVPINIGTGTGTQIPAPMLVLGGLVGLWALNIITGNWNGQLRWAKPFLPLILLIITAIMALILGLLPWYNFAPGASLAAQVGGLALFIFSALGFFWVSQQVRELRWLEIVTWIFIVLGLVLIVGNFWRPLSQIFSRFSPRGVINGSLFWTWMAALVCGQIVFNRRLRPIIRAALIAALGLQLAIAYFSNGDWKSGWVPQLVAIGTILVIRYPRLGILFALIGILPAVDFVYDLLEAEDYSYSTRMEAWEIVTEIVKVNPILGLGPSNYYFYTPLFPIRGYAVEFSSHNQYVDLLAQVGLLGLFLFIWFMVEIGRLGWRLRAHVEEGFHEAYVHAVLGGLVATAFAGMLGDWIVPFVYNVGFNGFRASMLAWIFSGGLIALAYQSGREALDA